MCQFTSAASELLKLVHQNVKNLINDIESARNMKEKNWEEREGVAICIANCGYHSMPERDL